MKEPRPEISCDVLIAGSGAGGMATAIVARHLGLDVIVAEKEPVFGGTTARSGGYLWIPGNPLARRHGVQDSKAEVLKYLRGETDGDFDHDRIDAYLSYGPSMVDFFERETDVTFDFAQGYPDYHPDRPGGSVGRSIVATARDARSLSYPVNTLAPPLRETLFMGLAVGSGPELKHFFNVTRSLRSAVFVANRLLRHAVEMAKYRRSMRLVAGNALAGRLRETLARQQVPLWLGAPVEKLLQTNGRVTGAEVRRDDGSRVVVHARKGVVLACGGFPQDGERTRRLYPHHPVAGEHVSLAPAGNTGDGIALGLSVGAAFDETGSNTAAWSPVSVVPRPDGTLGMLPHMIDKGKPGIIAVNAAGTRFTNESSSYHDFGEDMLRGIEAGDGRETMFMIADHAAIRRYGLGNVRPAPLPLGPHLRSGYLKQGRTLAELARACNIDAAALEHTVSVFNADARQARDDSFGKGGTSYNRFQGDASHSPNPCLSPLEKGPYYAVRILPGDIGTFAGLRSDAACQALDDDGRPVPGLFVVGNDMAGIMRGSYPGAGITLGPAMTFGYILGHALAEKPTSRPIPFD